MRREKAIHLLKRFFFSAQHTTQNGATHNRTVGVYFHHNCSIQPFTRRVQGPSVRWGFTPTATASLPNYSDRPMPIRTGGGSPTATAFLPMTRMDQGSTVRWGFTPTATAFLPMTRMDQCPSVRWGCTPTAGCRPT